MTHSIRFLSLALLLATYSLTLNHVNAQTDVVAFWGFENNFDFADGADGPNMQDHLADVDNTASGNANLQAFLGDAGDLDDNGGGGFASYTSPVSGMTFLPTRTIRFDDLAGPGDDFSIAGQSLFVVDSNDGLGPVAGDDFGNDALIYITLDGTGFQDFQFRFDIEGTPFDPDPDADPVTGVLEEPESFLPDEIDVFYRTTGPGGTWFRDRNNFDLTFGPLDPTDLENQVGSTGGYVALNEALDNASQIEIIISDFDRNGNGEMELDNIEIVANAVATPMVLLGDVNRDSIVSFADIPAFIELLISGEFQEEADVNEDDEVSFSDIPAFISILILNAQ